MSIRTSQTAGKWLEFSWNHVTFPHLRTCTDDGQMHSHIVVWKRQLCCREINVVNSHAQGMISFDIYKRKEYHFNSAILNKWVTQITCQIQIHLSKIYYSSTWCWIAFSRAEKESKYGWEYVEHPVSYREPNTGAAFCIAYQTCFFIPSNCHTIRSVFPRQKRRWICRVGQWYVFVSHAFRYWYANI